MVRKEFKHVVALFVAQAFDVGHPFRVDVERFGASGLFISIQTSSKNNQVLTGCTVTRGCKDSISLRREAPPTRAALAAITADEWTAFRPQTNSFIFGLSRLYASTRDPTRVSPPEGASCCMQQKKVIPGGCRSWVWSMCQMALVSRLGHQCF